ncbi:MAG: hypothetical protein ABSF37_12790 [Sedimentisphaerales bacterium]
MFAENSQSSHPGKWFWAAIAIGILIRLYLVLFTEGTYDAVVWKYHANGVRHLGLIEYYRFNKDMNHPPFISIAISLLPKISEVTRVPFETLLRIPFALLDGGTLLLLLNLLDNNRHRFALAAFYWLNPLAIIFSSFHGNTDSAIPFFVMLALWLLSKEKFVPAAATMGISLWVKLPAILAMPAFFFFLQGWRKRLLFLAVVGLVGISIYIPALITDAHVVYKNIFGYHGIVIRTNSGIPIWGCYIFLVPLFNSLPAGFRQIFERPFVFVLDNSWFVSLLLIILLSWLRRSYRTISHLGATIAASYTIIYGFSNNCAFQYFAWSIPFWLFTRPVFLLPATLFAGGYIYSLYWLLCGNTWLLGTCDFTPHPKWPAIVTGFRNLSILFFFTSACVFLIGPIYERARSKLTKNNNKQAAHPLKTR